MTEFEIVMTIVELRGQAVSLIQWWASISAGIIAGAHIFKQKLSMPLLSLLVSFYLFFTGVTSMVCWSVSQQMLAGFAQLNSLSDITLISASMVGREGSGYLLLVQVLACIASLAVILATCIYPFWVYKNDLQKDD